MAETHSRDADRFERYYAATENRPPRETLVAALDRSAGEGVSAGFAVDLGAGEGRDTVELLRRGWSVLAVDANAEALARLWRRCGPLAEGRLDTLAARFEDADWPGADLVNSSFALPLVEPERFDELWQRIRRRLRHRGRFAGQLFGPRDEWHGRAGIAFHTRDQVLALTQGFAVEMLEETEENAVLPSGKAKHWHLFHLVLRRTRSE
jgi:SAM-dependent methyltransferase